MKRFSVFLVSAALTLGISACSNQSDQVTGSQLILNTIKPGLLNKSKGKKPSSVSEQAAELANFRGSLILTSHLNTGQQQVLPEAARNGALRTYYRDKGMSFTLQHGVLVASKGAGVDLEGTRFSIPVSQMFSTRHDVQFVREIQHVDDELQVRSTEFNCAVKFEGAEPVKILDQEVKLNKFAETCTGQRRGFKNTYWLLPGSRTIKLSQQAISSDAGFVAIQHVR